MEIGHIFVPLFKVLKSDLLPPKVFLNIKRHIQVDLSLYIMIKKTCIKLCVIHEVLDKTSISPKYDQRMIYIVKFCSTLVLKNSLQPTLL